LAAPVRFERRRLIKQEIDRNSEIKRILDAGLPDALAPPKELLDCLLPPRDWE
jgi:hypothetical protein